MALKDQNNCYFSDFLVEHLLRSLDAAEKQLSRVFGFYRGAAIKAKSKRGPPLRLLTEIQKQNLLKRLATLQGHIVRIRGAIR